MPRLLVAVIFALAMTHVSFALKGEDQTQIVEATTATLVANGNYQAATQPTTQAQPAATLIGGLSPIVYLPGQWSGSVPASFHAPLPFEPPHPEGPRVPMQYYIPPGFYPPQFYPNHYNAYPSHNVVPLMNIMGMGYY